MDDKRHKASPNIFVSDSDSIAHDKHKSPFWFGFRLGLTSAGRLFTNRWPTYETSEDDAPQREDRMLDKHLD